MQLSLGHSKPADLEALLHRRPFKLDTRALHSAVD